MQRTCFIINIVVTFAITLRPIPPGDSFASCRVCPSPHTHAPHTRARPRAHSTDLPPELPRPYEILLYSQRCTPSKRMFPGYGLFGEWIRKDAYFNQRPLGQPSNAARLCSARLERVKTSRWEKDLQPKQTKQTENSSQNVRGATGNRHGKTHVNKSQKSKQKQETNKEAQTTVDNKDTSNNKENLFTGTSINRKGTPVKNHTTFDCKKARQCSKRAVFAFVLSMSFHMQSRSVPLQFH